MKVEICNGRVMGSVLAENLSTIWELTLESLPKNRVERLVLSGANIQATH
jgi:hypothetical protein